MALTLADAYELHDVASMASGKTITGYNYLHNPTFTHARQLIESDVIGRIVHFLGAIDEDYQADLKLAWTWWP